jgi:hypothetical protein
MLGQFRFKFFLDVIVSRNKIDKNQSGTVHHLTVKLVFFNLNIKDEFRIEFCMFNVTQFF